MLSPSATVPAESEVRTPGQAARLNRYHQGAVIAWLVERNQRDPNFGRTKLVKELYFIQHHLDVDLQLGFVREAAGPLDQAVYPVENLARKEKWISVSGKRGSKATYRSGPRIETARGVAMRTIGDRLPEVEALLRFFDPFDTLTMEQWATVHQVWDDRRAQRRPLTAAGIVADVLAWKGGKRGFDRWTVPGVLDRMVRAGMIELEA